MADFGRVLKVASRVKRLSAKATVITMAPRPSTHGADTDVDASMSDAPEHRRADEMVGYDIAVSALLPSVANS